ncbi:VWA domain-containing protein [Lentibacter sp. XHP0401]|uniref:VWA domain-containing protein n=1 Tax=Lentibacter sp. XHP0401 TaxID=2984334 RepID=UPI0021E98469|nr:VWA domain-containing protein [Lentibacter sp. XHP0401]MCV2894348.1 VWA domain-containing protein [Lentibacter sp. XHP0401]
MRFFTILLLCLSLVPSLSSAQDRANTILVLDGSGSMWGQIDGVNKIVIARDVVGKILADFPPEENLGLTVYGHRERGNCADIETIVAPGPHTAADILAAVNAINPRGKTPMTDAIIAAAQALRYTEEAATVILVSDGIETCNPDPCAAARALEEAGIDFTAHVVGFDVTEAAALAQMQCIADETGGAFLTASNADELADALSKVTAPVAPEPLAAPLTFRAIRGEDGPEVTADIVWEISDSKGVVVKDGVATSEEPFSTDLVVSEEYTAIARDVANGSEGITHFVVDVAPLTVTVVLPVPQPDATITAQDTAPVGATIPVEWTGPNDERDYISVAAVDQTGTSYVNYTYISDLAERGLLMPPTTGTYELRYVSSATNSVLATRPITITPVEVMLTAPTIASAGESITVEWNGPDYERDYISVASPDGNGGTYVNYTYTKDGSPLSLLMPSEAGDYELRYILAQGNTIMARASISVQRVAATLAAPDTAAVGETIAVDWTGPNYDRDYISVAKVGGAGGQYENYTYTKEGTPLSLLMPSEAGTYEVRYIVSQDNVILANRTITVKDVDASLTAPSVAPMGASVVVEWMGPDYDRDYISVARVGVDGGQYVNYTYTESGSPLNLLMPSQAGDYEIRYILAQDNVILSREPVTVTPVDAKLTAPLSVALSAQSISVDWDGPDYSRDYISISKTGESGYVTYAYTKAGNPLTIQLPDAAGEYEIRYVLGQNEVVLGATLLTVTAD